MNWAIVADILLVSRWAGPALGQILGVQGVEASLALNGGLHPFLKPQPQTGFRVQPQVGL